MSNTVGVPWNGRICVVEFTVSDSKDWRAAESISIINIRQFFPETRCIVDLVEESIEELACNIGFCTATLWAVASFSHDFDPESYRPETVN